MTIYLVSCEVVIIRSLDVLKLKYNKHQNPRSQNLEPIEQHDEAIWPYLCPPQYRGRTILSQQEQLDLSHPLCISQSPLQYDQQKRKHHLYLPKGGLIHLTRRSSYTFSRVSALCELEQLTIEHRQLFNARPYCFAAVKVVQELSGKVCKITKTYIFDIYVVLSLVLNNSPIIKAPLNLFCIVAPKEEIIIVLAIAQHINSYT